MMWFSAEVSIRSIPFEAESKEDAMNLLIEAVEYSILTDPPYKVEVIEKFAYEVEDID
jgi:hypothetical protein